MMEHYYHWFLDLLYDISFANSISLVYDQQRRFLLLIAIKPADSSFHVYLGWCATEQRHALQTRCLHLHVELYYHSFRERLAKRATRGIAEISNKD